MFNNRVNPQLFFSILLASLLTPSAYAYQFGPPPITELAEAGGSQNRLSLYSQSLEYDNSPLKPTLQGISFVSSTGDRSGSGSGIFRLAQYKDNRTASGARSDSTGILFGAGYGAQWYLGEQRNFGLLLNGQFDYLMFKYDQTASSTVTNSQPAFGLEGGAVYRIFIDQATVTPFVSAMTGKRARAISFSNCSSCGYTVNYTDSGTTIGVDLMWGRFSASALQTKASYTATASGSPTVTQKSTISMIMLGMNF
jgi:hypothetical protein